MRSSRSAGGQAVRFRIACRTGPLSCRRSIVLTGVCDQMKGFCALFGPEASADDDVVL